mmetsp:Transcript_2117/g.3042  ORF Transcript_2117/g.3042 Transcript_2117/m.3042 type:complete len:85 (+) Transcript_2117:313-567(+)
MNQHCIINTLCPNFLCVETAASHSAPPSCIKKSTNAASIKFFAHTCRQHKEKFRPSLSCSKIRSLPPTSTNFDITSISALHSHT